MRRDPLTGVGNRRLLEERLADELRRHAADMAANGIRSVAISSVFSPVNHDLELAAAEVVREELGAELIEERPRVRGER